MESMTMRAGRREPLILMSSAERSTSLQPSALRIGLGVRPSLARRRLDARVAREFAVDAGHSFDLAPGREPLVETLVAEGAPLLGPGRQPFAPALDPILSRLGIL